MTRWWAPPKPARSSAGAMEMEKGKLVVQFHVERSVGATFRVKIYQLGGL